MFLRFLSCVNGDQPLISGSTLSVTPLGIPLPNPLALPLIDTL